MSYDNTVEIKSKKQGDISVELWAGCYSCSDDYNDWPYWHAEAIKWDKDGSGRKIDGDVFNSREEAEREYERLCNRYVMTKRLTNNRVVTILGNLGKMPHYLADKPVSQWDKYDNSNWNAIIRNTIYEKDWSR